MPTFDENKTKALMAYIASKVDVGTTKLMKLLYLIDFTYYEKTGKAITNDEYKNFPYGPIPLKSWKGLKNGFAQDFISETNEPRGTGRYVKYSSKVKESHVAKEFTKDELEVINSVLAEHGGKFQEELVRMVHDEFPYQITSDQEDIPYFLAPYRKYKKLTPSELKKVRANKPYIQSIKDAFRDARRVEGRSQRMEPAPTSQAA